MIEKRAKTSVLFVCMGNICRSPTAEAMLIKKIKDNNLETLITVDSCGTHGYHVGGLPDARAIAAGASRGLALGELRARQIEPADFHRFDYVLAMDRDNLRELEKVRPIDSAARLIGLLSYSLRYKNQDVPDPYYGGDAGFEHVLDMLDEATDQLLAMLQEGNTLG
jgi:protein-tyrosine phosphatase